jgi:3-deoxy-D-manno-octulosonate 8-phosphate phosphatase (KDO 8-P phosphatase)
MLQQAGIACAIITGRNTKLVERRARNLGIAHLLQGREDKLVALREVAEQLSLSLAQIAYVGDDWPDLPTILAVGLGIAVANAHPELLAHAHYKTQQKGGRGAVREVCDLLLKAQGRYASALAPYRDHGFNHDSNSGHD